MDPEFENELMKMNDKKGASASRIASLTKLAMANVKTYKEVVYCIEKYVHKSASKLSGLYLIDSICRASIKQSSSVYIKRVLFSNTV
jgi:CID domain